jgi:hypothetical protein
MPHVQFSIKQGDTAPALEGICRDGFGSPVNLTGATVLFKMRLAPAGAVKIASGAMGAVGNVVLGRQKYSWSTSDTDTAGTYEGEVQATFSDGRIRTFPPDGYFTIEITDDI